MKRLFAWLARLAETETLPPAQPELVQRAEVFVDATCPCGSDRLLQLSLHATAECLRCGHEVGILAVAYERRARHELQVPEVIVGYVPPAFRLSRSQVH
jgi:hypothetical protein